MPNITQHHTNGNVDGFQQVKIATIENRTNFIEQTLTLLTSKLDNLQFNFLASNKTSDKPTNENFKIAEVQIYLCDICDFQTSD